MKIALYEPEIPPNTGTISRLCAGLEIPLHLIEPLGFSLDDKHVRRAGLDYWEYVQIHRWKNYAHFIEHHSTARVIYTSTKYGVPLHTFRFYPEDILMFGPETRGLPKELLEQEVQRAHTCTEVTGEYHPPHIVSIATRSEVRSLNLALVVGIVTYQALISSGLVR